MLADPQIRLAIVDDHPVVREGVASQLRLHRDITVVGHASTGQEGIQLCARERPDIVLLDLRLPDAPAADVVKSILSVSPDIRILIFTAFPDHVSVASTMAAGAVGLLVKDVAGAVLHKALREVMRVGHYRSTRRSEPESASAPITPREYDVLRLVASGHTNGEIGEELGISLNTVKAYVSNVMSKLSARNRAQLISNSRTQGLL